MATCRHIHKCHHLNPEGNFYIAVTTCKDCGEELGRLVADEDLVKAFLEGAKTKFKKEK